jgi:hypothetical protein
MHMKKLLCLVALFIFLSTITKAQLWKIHRYELSGGIGTSQLYGDIGGYSNGENILGLKDFAFRHTRFNINGSLRYRITENISARVNLVFGFLHSTDSKGSNTGRGFESGTVFAETSLIGEYYFIKNKGENSYVFLKGKNSILYSIFQSLDFYAFTGIGGLIYNVTPNSILSPYVNQRSGLTGVVPVGLGVSMIYNSKFNIGVELGGRFTFTDNLDGYTSVHSKANDVYHLLNFTFIYKINTSDKGIPVFGK